MSWLHVVAVVPSADEARLGDILKCVQGAKRERWRGVRDEACKNGFVVGKGKGERPKLDPHIGFDTPPERGGLQGSFH